MTPKVVRNASRKLLLSLYKMNTESLRGSTINKALFLHVSNPGLIQITIYSCKNCPEWPLYKERVDEVHSFKF